MAELLHWDLKTLFLFLANSTMCINDEAANRVWNDMAYKLMEWNNTSRCELRAVFNKFDMQFQELCSSCNDEMLDYEGDEEEPKCESCK
jgi:hypothetical protein